MTWVIVIGRWFVQDCRRADDSGGGAEKHAATQKLNPELGGGWHTWCLAVLVAMTLFEPGTMRISTPDQKLPAWLLDNYQQIFAEPLSQ